MRVPPGAPGDAPLPPLPAALALVAGMYVTDGRALLRVEHVRTDPSTGATFVELEDCRTSELSVCTADSLAARPLRGVVPGEAPLVGSRAGRPGRGERTAAPR